MSKPLNYQIIVHARKLITNRKHWERHKMFIIDGQPYRLPQILKMKRKPDRFCAVGALHYACFQLTSRRKLPEALNDQVALIMAINDSAGHRAALRTLDEMLEKTAI